MFPVRPVLLDKPKAKTVMVAKDQEEYQTLPSLFLNDKNICLSRWVFDDAERLILEEYKGLYLYVPLFVAGVQPTAFCLSPEPHEINTELVHNVFAYRQDKYDIIYPEQALQAGIWRYYWTLTSQEVERILDANSIYVYQFNGTNREKLITPYTMSVYSDQTILI